MDRDKIIMANARRLIKRHKSMSNRELYLELFGAGSSTAHRRCVELGFDPDGNTTHYYVKVES